MRRWVPPVVVGGLLGWTVLVMPLSVGIGKYLAYYDPQSDAELLEYHRDVAAHVYTAGHWAGQLVAALAGVWLVRRAGEFRPATITWAGFSGALLGLGTTAVAIAVGVPALLRRGYPIMVAEPSVWWCLAASVACFPLWAVAGAATAGVLHRRAVLAVVAAILCQPATLLLTAGIAAPPSSHPVAVATIAGAGPAALVMPAILLGWATTATVAALLVTHRRRSQPAR
ncbi:hypothetical protein [Actinoplanes sp. N902-109]|uniref:hypothetical protein n=1 Tax=Actinoplanes sp. (strain N902-109) TaxID=649831 RepID=UPI00059F2F06|nr:hypothetical protein [Actinoplanes sp. N902-109]